MFHPLFLAENEFAQTLRHSQNILCYTLKQTFYVYHQNLYDCLLKEIGKILVKGQLYHVYLLIKNSSPGQTNFLPQNGTFLIWFMKNWLG
jgi:hypothetical protein